MATVPSLKKKFSMWCKTGGGSAKKLSVSPKCAQPKTQRTMKNYPFIQDIPAAEYHAAATRGEFLSSHNLALFRACPALIAKTIGQMSD